MLARLFRPRRAPDPAASPVAAQIDAALAARKAARIANQERARRAAAARLRAQLERDPLYNGDWR